MYAVLPSPGDLTDISVDLLPGATASVADNDFLLRVSLPGGDVLARRKLKYPRTVIAVSEDRFVVTQSFKKAALLVDGDFKTVHKFAAHKMTSIQSVAINPGGRWVATGGYGGEVLLHSLADGSVESRVTFKGNSRESAYLTFNADGSRLAVLAKGYIGPFRVFEPPSLAEVCCVEAPNWFFVPSVDGASIALCEGFWPNDAWTRFDFASGSVSPLDLETFRSADEHTTLHRRIVRYHTFVQRCTHSDERLRAVLMAVYPRHVLPLAHGMRGFVSRDDVLHVWTGEAPPGARVAGADMAFVELFCAPDADPGDRTAAIAAVAEAAGLPPAEVAAGVASIEEGTIFEMPWDVANTVARDIFRESPEGRCAVQLLVS